MIENSNLELEFSEMLIPPKRMLFLSLIGLNYQKQTTVLNYKYCILNFISETSVVILFPSYYISTYVI